MISELQHASEQIALLVRGKGPEAAINGITEYINSLTRQLQSDILKENMEQEERNILLAYAVGMMAVVETVRASLPQAIPDTPIEQDVISD